MLLVMDFFPHFIDFFKAILFFSFYCYKILFFTKCLNCDCFTLEKLFHFDDEFKFETNVLSVYDQDLFCNAEISKHILSMRFNESQFERRKLFSSVEVLINKQIKLSYIKSYLTKNKEESVYFVPI